MVKITVDEAYNRVKGLTIFCPRLKRFQAVFYPPNCPSCKKKCKEYYDLLEKENIDESEAIKITQMVKVYLKRRRKNAIQSGNTHG